MAITSAGVGSGLDLEAIISATVDAENLPKVAQLDKRESAVDLQITALGQMKSDLTAFNSQLDILKDISNFTKRASTVTQPSTGGDLINVTSESTATPGSFEITDVVKAQGSRLQSSAGNEFTATTDVVTASGGTLTLTAGAKTFNVTLSAGATLADLRTAINDASDNFGVSANIINTGSNSQLVLTSDETGTGNDLTITNDTAELDKVSTTANGGGAGGLGSVISAQDASMKIDGITVTSSTNTFTNAIQDSTITVLRDSDPANLATDKATLNVDTDKEFVKETLDAFVSSYNSLINTLNTVATSKTADATARGLRRTIIDQMGTFVSGAGNLQSVYDIGLEMDKDNNIKFSSTAVNTLDDALANSYDDIGTLFAGAGGVAVTLSASVDTYLNSSGVFKQQEDALDQQKDDITQSREDHTYRMQMFEERLREKYANLDVLIAGLRSQGTAITSSLANLPGFTKSE